MITAIIAAMGRDRVIGHRNALPWRLPADLRHFRNLTMGKPVVMGRKTHESIGQALAGRTNIVISRDPRFDATGCTVVGSLEQALQACEDYDEAMVIGGASLYAQTLPRAGRMYLTLIDARFDGDIRFPAFDAADWRECARSDHHPDEQNPYAYSFVTLARQRNHSQITPRSAP